MSARRLFLAAVCAATLAPAATAAATLAPVWQTSSIASGPGGDAVWPRVLATPDGAIAVVWSQSDGSNLRVAANVRSTAGVWSGAEWVSPAGEDNASPVAMLTGTAADNSFAIGWANGSYAQFLAHRDSDDSEWTVTPAATAADPGEWFDGGAMSTGPAPRLTQITTGGIGGDRKVRIRQRDAGTETLSLIAEFEQPDGYSQSEPKLTYNRNGDAIAFWRASPPSADQEIRAARYDKSENRWSDPETVFADASIQEYNGALSDSGDAALIVTTGAQDTVYGVTLDGSRGDWTLSPDLKQTGPNNPLVDVVADGDGQFIAAWQEFDYSNPGAPPKIVSRTFRPGSGWSGVEDVAAPLSGGGAPSLAVNADGDVAIGLLTSTNPPTPMMGVATRDSGASEFGPVEILKEGDVTAGSTPGIPRIALDGLGNVAAVYADNAESSTRIGFVAGDGSGPRLDSVTVPATATAGQAVTVSVDPFDLWSGVATTSWDFGEGGTATGASASHTFASAGTYTVTVTAGDLAGNSTSTTRQITVSAPPAPQPAPPAKSSPKPKQTLAPVIEARLSGRTVTLNAKVTLKRGQKCQGTITATTAFGGKSYKAPAKLALKDGACRATAKITLKKTPSLRTKLRITVGTTKADKKKIGSRTVTSRRG